MFDEEFIRRKNAVGEDNQNELALEILRDIALTFGNTSEFTKVKNHENSAHLPPPKKYKESYLFNYIYVLILGLIGLIAFFYNRNVIVLEKQNRRECRDVAIYGFKEEVVHLNDCSEEGVELTKSHCLRWKGSGITIYPVVLKVEVDGVELQPLN